MKQTQRINIRRKQSCIYDVIYHVKNLMETKILLAVVIIKVTICNVSIKTNPMYAS